LAKQGNYQEASKKLFKLSFLPKYRKQRDQIRYILGMMLFQMELNQLSAYQFISVIKHDNRKYLRPSLEKLSIAADDLGDDTLLNYAISRVKVEQFPRALRDMLYFRVGEYQMRAKAYAQAAISFSKVKRTSSNFSSAKYMQGLAYAEMKHTKHAIATFADLYDSRANKPVTDPARVAALAGMARTYYQQKNWDKSIETYREIPRDTELWHDGLFEMSWAMLRSGRFRSALSNFQTIHSSFYENFYLPESLLLRSIVYLYICKYDEMEKVLNLYNHLYKPIYRRVKDYLTTVRRASTYYNDVSTMMAEYIEKGDDKFDKSKFKMPFVVGRQLSKEGEYKRATQYIAKLQGEMQKISNMPGDWRNAAIGRYAMRVLKTRIKRAKQKAGRDLRRYMVDIRNDLFDLFEQEGFIRYEMINGKKESLKKRVAGKDLPSDTVDKDTERDYYVQNGYQYWPFQGEYWLDELGNYHYLGTQSCE